MDAIRPCGRRCGEPPANYILAWIDHGGARLQVRDARKAISPSLNDSACMFSTPGEVS